jgi:hypothetical protein
VMGGKGEIECIEVGMFSYRIDDCVVFVCKSKMHGLETISLIPLLLCLLPSGAGNVGKVKISVSAVTPGRHGPFGV